MRLFARIFDESKPDVYPWVPVEFDRKGRPVIPKEYTFEDGRSIKVENVTSYFIRGTWFDPVKQKNRQQTAPAGKTIDEAVAALARLQAVKHGVVSAAAVQEAGDRKRIGYLVTQFQTERETLGKAKDTMGGYRNALRRFLAYCKHAYPDQVTRQDIIGFIQYLRDNMEFLDGSDESARNNTIKNELTKLRTFLKWANGKNWEFPLAQREWPRVTKKLPKKYSLRLVTKMLEKATEDEKDQILFHLYTGFRSGEVRHSKYSDINFPKGTVNVSDKAEWNWKIKDREHRPKSIRVPKDFIARMRKRMERHKTADDSLIFPNSEGRPDKGILEDIRAVAKRSGIKANIIAELDLRKFRRTFATEYSKQYGIEETRQMLGHSDIKTTQIYLAAEEIDVDGGNEAEHEARIEDMWAAVGD